MVLEGNGGKVMVLRHRRLARKQRRDGSLAGKLSFSRASRCKELIIFRDPASSNTRAFEGREDAIRIDGFQGTFMSARTHRFSSPSLSQQKHRKTRSSA